MLGRLMCMTHAGNHTLCIRLLPAERPSALHLVGIAAHEVDLHDLECRKF